MKELKIGERVTITLEAVEQSLCDGCYFDSGNICLKPTGGFQCCPKDRSDGKDVIFKLVNV
jgi:hypothetical protein